MTVIATEHRRELLYYLSSNSTIVDGTAQLSVRGPQSPFAKLLSEESLKRGERPKTKFRTPNGIRVPVPLGEDSGNEANS